jgi:hypothetical protein
MNLAGLPTGLSPSRIEHGYGKSKLAKIVRFLAPKDGPAHGRLRQGFYGHDRLGFGITRADIAAFTAAQVDKARYIGAAPAISN